MLLKTIEAFNSACNHIAIVAFRRKCFSTFHPHHFVYHEVMEEFKHSSQMAVHAIGNVTDACKVDRTAVRRYERRRHLSWSFAQPRSFIEYKATVSGVPVVAVDTRNISRTCPGCGTVDRANRPAGDDFRCGSCSLAGPADSIAAVNIAAMAGVDQPIAAGNEDIWAHFSGLGYNPPVLTGRC